MEEKQVELKETVVAINRVAKVVKGGRTFRFSAVVVVGDEQGHVGVGNGKAAEVPDAIKKAIEDAKKNLVTVPIVGSVAIAGYQDKEFVLSNNAIALYSKYKDFNKYHAMFIIPILKLEKFRYGYGRKWGLGRMEQSVIKLPTTPEGEPDYQFMEDYIKTLPYSKYI